MEKIELPVYGDLQLVEGVMHRYKIRYLIEAWDKPAPLDSSKPVMPGVRVSGNDYGYTDDLFVVSIVDLGERESFLILSSSEGGPPGREMVEKIIDCLQHYLEEHCE